MENATMTPLVAGMAHFEMEGLEPLLGWWASLANQQGPKVEPPGLYWVISNDDPREALLNWAWAVQLMGDEGRDDVSPISDVYETDHGSILLSWEGRWTCNRSICIEVVFSYDEDYPQVSGSHCVMTWESGTGRPSTFLDVERFLTLDSCFDYEPLLDFVTKCEQEAAAAATRPRKSRSR